MIWFYFFLHQNSAPNEQTKQPLIKHLCNLYKTLTVPVLQFHLALLLHVTSSVLLIFIPPTFLQGFVHVVVSKSRLSVKKPNFLRVWGNVLGDDGKTSVLAGQGSNIFQLTGGGPNAGLFIWSIRQLQSSDFKVEFKETFKVSYLPLAHKTREYSLSEEWGTWLKKKI